jgi:tRNA dimethylallyltransferase
VSKINQSLVLAICGPTASGKTDVAMYLARELNAEIINFDSIQVFKKLDIGSSKPAQAMLDEIPHHLISIVEPNEPYTAGDFKRQAEEIIFSQIKKSKPVILVGGTGFYLQALTKGMYDLKPVANEIKEQLKTELAQSGLEKLFKEVEKIDSEYSKKISVNDTYRILRALEVWRGFQKTPTEIRQSFQKTKPGFDILQIGLYKEREVLRKVVNERTEKMLAQGLIEETEAILSEYGMQKPLSSVGYKEACSYLAGQINFVNLSEVISNATMKLSKRQMTWFKRDKISWFDTSRGLEQVTGDIKRTFHLDKT